jgi:hypothetical protein
MPLAPCPDCGNECSTLAKACPQCGRPLESSESRRDESGPSVEASRSRCESEEKRSARERKERIAKIPVTSRVLADGRGRRPALDLEKPPVSSVTKRIVVFAVVVAVIFLVVILGAKSDRNGQGGAAGNYNSFYNVNSNAAANPASRTALNSNYQRTTPGSNANAPSPTLSNADTSREDEITRRRYEECVRQRESADLDTSPCSEWATER